MGYDTRESLSPRNRLGRADSAERYPCSLGSGNSTDPDGSRLVDNPVTYCESARRGGATSGGADETGNSGSPGEPSGNSGQDGADKRQVTSNAIVISSVTCVTRIMSVRRDSPGGHLLPCYLVRIIRKRTC